MSKVTINFIGVCTHLSHVPMTPPADALSPSDTNRGHYSRAITVNGRFGAFLAGHKVPPHVQYLHIPNKFLSDDTPLDIPGLFPVDETDEGTYWTLEGAHLYIANATPGLTKTKGFDLIPGLTDVSGELSLMLDEKVIIDGRAASEFAIYAGVFDAYHLGESNDAIVAKLTVTTADAAPVLVVKRVWDQTITRVALKDDAFLYVLNVGEETDKDTDFLLHYYATTWTPPAGFVPRPRVHPDLRKVTPEDGLQHMGRLPSGLTLGCSNSNYP